MSSPNPTSNHSQIPTQFCAISRNNSSASTASSSIRGDLSSVSTTNSVTSSRSHLNKNHLVDHKQILATCGSSTPLRSFQRATISSVVKTRAFDNSPVLQSLLVAASPSGQSSVSNSQTPSPHSTPAFSRSRSLRMSGGPSRYQRNSPSNQYRTATRTPELHSFNSGDILNCSAESSAKLSQLNSEKFDLKESLEFLECERQVLIDSTHELKETLHNERSQWKKEIDDLRKQLTDCLASRIKAESLLVQSDVEKNDLRVRIDKLNDSLASKDRHLAILNNNLEKLQSEHQDLTAMNQQLKRMLTEKLVYNGTISNNSINAQQISDCESIVTAMARLRLELNEKDKLIDELTTSSNNDCNLKHQLPNCNEIDMLNKFLDQTVECIKGWPEDLAGSSHVQDLMRTLLNAYKSDNPNALALQLERVHI